MKLAVFLCVLACMLVSSFAADEVKLLFVKSVGHDCPFNGNEYCSMGDDWYRTMSYTFTAEVKNLAYEKAVSIWFKHPMTGNWTDFFLVWRSSGDLSHTTNPKENTDIFVGTMTLNLTEAVKGNLTFVVKYKVNSMTYWAHNTTDNNKDFQIAGNGGVYLASNKLILNAEYQTANASISRYWRPYGYPMYDKTYFQFMIVTRYRNLANSVLSMAAVHYAPEGSSTWTDYPCFYTSAPWMINGEWGSQTASNPSEMGYLAWTCSVLIDISTGARPQYVDYAVYTKYEDGQVAWDNNYTRNYRTYLTWAQQLS